MLSRKLSDRTDHEGKSICYFISETEAAQSFDESQIEFSSKTIC